MGEARLHVTFYVAVADVSAALAIIEGKGGQKTFGPQSIPDSGIVTGFLDPEDHLIGLCRGQRGCERNLLPKINTLLN